MEPKINKDHRRMFELLRAGISLGTAECTLFQEMEEADWKRLYSIAKEHGVMAVAWEGICSLPRELQPESDFRIQWAFNEMRISSLFQKKKQTAMELAGHFAQKGIRTCLMKGLVTARHYPIPAHREFGDIDIYLMGDYSKGNECARSLGCKVRHQYFVHSEFYFNKINIENHRYFINPYVNRYARAVERFLEKEIHNAHQSAFLPGILEPSALFAAVFNLRHSAWHFARESLKLRDLLDWALFLRANFRELDQQELNRILESSSMKRWASILSGAANIMLSLEGETLFGERDPEMEKRVLEDICSFRNPDKKRNISFINAFRQKITHRFERRWCYSNVVPDSLWGNIFFSVGVYLIMPWEIFRAKL